MPASRRTPWLICYDIADPPRLQRVHRTISRHANPLQYSVFHTNATRSAIAEVLGEVAAHIDPRQDDVRAYPLLTTARPLVYGRTSLPNRVLLLDQQAGSLFYSGNFSPFGC